MVGKAFALFFSQPGPTRGKECAHRLVSGCDFMLLKDTSDGLANVAHVSRPRQALGPAAARAKRVVCAVLWSVDEPFRVAIVFRVTFYPLETSSWSDSSVEHKDMAPK